MKSAEQVLIKAEQVLIKAAQAEAFIEEIEVLTPIETLNESSPSSKRNDLKNSSVYCVNPFVNEYSILGVGGRIRRSRWMYDEEHPVLLPKDNHLSLLIIRYYYEQTQYQGQLIAQGAVLQGGYWIVGCKQMISKMLNQCVICKCLRGRPWNNICPTYHPII